MTQQAGAVLYNGLGRYDAALAAVREAADVPMLSELGSPRAVLELIEAAVRSGERALAARALDRLVQSTRPSGSDWALGVEARSRALLADGDDAERLYREAIARLERTGMRFQLARTHLLYGEWLRRERNRLAARRAPAHRPRAVHGDGHRSLRRARGTRARGRRRARPQARLEPQDELTAQETQIARLARDGLSNPEIGARLFISPRTVEYHLRKVYSKLNIDSAGSWTRYCASSLPPARAERGRDRARPDQAGAGSATRGSDDLCVLDQLVLAAEFSSARTPAPAASLCARAWRNAHPLTRLGGPRPAAQNA